MATLIRTELADVLGQMPEMTSLCLESLAADSPDDLFLCALGFEPRCLTLPKKLRRTSYRTRRAVYFRYATNVEDNSVNLACLNDSLRGIATEVQPLDADADDFPERFSALLDVALGRSESESASVTFDVSVAANRLLLRCMRVLLERNVRLRVIYSEAEVYHPTKQEYTADPEKWQTDEEFGLERGVKQVIPSVDHPGHSLDPMPDCVVLFPSFKRERSNAVINFVDPSLLISPGNKVVWLVGRPHLSENAWRVGAMRTINRIRDSAPQREVCTFDYRDTLKVLQRLHRERSENQTITLSPLGSKMQALGTTLFCHMHPDVRIILSTPKEYNAAQYSEGCRDVWGLDFGSLAELRRNLDRVGTLHIAE